MQILGGFKTRSETLVFRDTSLNQKKINPPSLLRWAISFAVLPAWAPSRREPPYLGEYLSHLTQIWPGLKPGVPARLLQGCKCYGYLSSKVE